MSFAQLLTTLILASYTLAAPLATVQPGSLVDTALDPNVVTKAIRDAVPFGVSGNVAPLFDLPGADALAPKIPTTAAKGLGVAAAAFDSVAGPPQSESSDDTVWSRGIATERDGSVGPIPTPPQEAIDALRQEASGVAVVDPSGKVHDHMRFGKLMLTPQGLTSGHPATTGDHINAIGAGVDYSVGAESFSIVQSAGRVSVGLPASSGVQSGAHEVLVARQFTSDLIITQNVNPPAPPAGPEIVVAGLRGITGGSSP